MIFSYTDEITLIFNQMNLPDDVIHLILFHKKKDEMEEALQYNLEMRSVWNYSNYPFFHKYHMHLIDIRTSLNVLFDETFWKCILKDASGDEIMVVSNISQLGARPKDKLYEPVKQYLTHKPWDNPMIHRLQKIDLYNTDSQTFDAVWSCRPNSLPYNPNGYETQFTPVWDTIERFDIKEHRMIEYDIIRWVE